MRIFRKNKEQGMEIDEIVGKSVLHSVEFMDKTIPNQLTEGIVVALSVDPINETVILVFQDGSTTVWNPEHDENPIRGRSVDVVTLVSE